jgi:hypothetical protein
METKHGSCWYNAECVREPGNAKPGDGFVGVSCNEHRCTCTRETATPDHTHQEETFSIAELCTKAELAKELLVERCMAGMPPPK